MSQTKYKLTSEHEKELGPWAEKWIANALNCNPIGGGDKKIITQAVIGLYKSASLPPPKNIVFVPSPFVLRFASGFASAIWYLRKRGGKKKPLFYAAATLTATRNATWDATDAATRCATEAATRNATEDATEAATRCATEAATRNATRNATEAATEAATLAATRNATWDATDAATRAATRDATRNATRNATWAATMAATWDAIEAATQAATRNATEAATLAATQAATRNATEDATEAATRNATEAATLAATLAATRNATEAATLTATWDATEAATRNASTTNNLVGNWYSFPITDMVALSEQLGLFDFGLKCSTKVWHMWQGGNQWSGSVSFISFFRHIVKLDLDYSKWEYWERLADLSGPRVVHPDFCMISDKPLYIKMDDQNRPHCYDGPFCEWRDGSKLYSIHGVRVPGKYCETPADKINPEEVLRETNAEIRTALIKKCGFGHFKNNLKTKLISKSNNNELLEFDLGDSLLVRGLLVRWDDKHSSKETIIPVPRTKEQFESTGDVPDDIDDVEQVRRWTLFAKKEDEFLAET